MSAVQLIVASVVLGLLAPLVSGSVPDVRGLSWPVIGSVLTLGAVGTGIAFVIHLRNIRLVGASTASMVTYIVPVFATVVGAVVLGEGITWYQPVGAALVLLGVAVAEGALQPSPQAESGAGAVKETELWQRLQHHLGAGYYRVWAAEFSLAALRNRTVVQALREGESSKTIWRAVWEALELPDRDR